MVQLLLGFVPSHSDGPSDANAPPTPVRPPRSPTAEDEPITPLGTLDSHAFKKEFINEKLGTGLVATKEIEPGTIVFVEPVVWVRKWEQAVFKKRASVVTTLVERKAQMMGEDWYEKFISLSHQDDGDLSSRTASIWNVHGLPVARNGRVAGAILGLKLAWVNHSCVPNCTVSIVTVVPRNKKDEIVTDARPIYKQAILRACKGIAPGEELTVPYIYVLGKSDQRREMVQKLYEFVCACSFCENLILPVEDAYYHAVRLDCLIRKPAVVSDEPAIAFHAAHETVTRFVGASIFDLRFVWVFLQCALVAAYHSDLARAYCFLTLALPAIATSQGEDSFLYRRTSRWLANIHQMPGAGGTTWGLSTIAEGKYLCENEVKTSEILFMLHAGPSDYIRVKNHRRRPDADAEDARRKYELVEPADKIAPPPRMSSYPDNRGQHCISCDKKVCCPVGKATRPKRRGVKAGKSASKGKDVCVDPEIDFLDGMIGAVNAQDEGLSAPLRGMALSEKKEVARSGPSREVQEELVTPTAAASAARAEENQDAGGGKKKKKKKKKRKNRKKNKKKNQNGAQPVVQDVGAKKPVTMVQEGESPGPSSLCPHKESSC